MIGPNPPSRISRKDDQCPHHQQRLQEIGPADRPEAAGYGVDQNDGPADQHAVPVFEASEDRGEGLTRRGELGGDVEHHGHQDDQDREDPDEGEALPEPQGKEIRQGQGFKLPRPVAQAWGDHKPVE